MFHLSLKMCAVSLLVQVLPTLKIIRHRRHLQKVIGHHPRGGTPPSSTGPTTPPVPTCRNGLTLTETNGPGPLRRGTNEMIGRFSILNPPYPFIGPPPGGSGGPPAIPDCLTIPYFKLNSLTLQLKWEGRLESRTRSRPSIQNLTLSLPSRGTIASITRKIVFTPGRSVTVPLRWRDPIVVGPDTTFVVTADTTEIMNGNATERIASTVSPTGEEEVPSRIDFKVGIIEVKTDLGASDSIVGTYHNPF